MKHRIPELEVSKNAERKGNQKSRPERQYNFLMPFGCEAKILPLKEAGLDYTYRCPDCGKIVTIQTTHVMGARNSIDAA